MFDQESGDAQTKKKADGWSRRHALGAAAVALGNAALPKASARTLPADSNLCRDDLAIDATTALLYCAEAPLKPGDGLRDARAVWCRVPPFNDGTVLIYLHGHNGYVTVDATGRSRVPDWAAGNDAARAGAGTKRAAPLVYALDRLDSHKTGKMPVVLVPEVSTLASGSFWAKEPAGQYANPARLGLLIADCGKHLANLRRPDGAPYLQGDFLSLLGTENHRARRTVIADLNRIYLSGHSGAGLPLEEAASSTLLSPASGPGVDLWLFDCTYWSKVDGFVSFCEKWHRADRLAAGRRGSARFVCIYQPQTQTEEVADDLRARIAKVMRVEPSSLVKDHTALNLEQEIRPALKTSGALFVRTFVAHDEIPTYFIPVLLESAPT